MPDDDDTTEPAGFVPELPEPETPLRHRGPADKRPFSERPLTVGEIERRLSGMPGWNLGLGGRSIVRRFDFADYAHAQAFASLVGTFSAAGNYYPYVEIQRFRVRIKLGGRQIGEVTELVFQLAEQFELAARGLGAG